MTPKKTGPKNCLSPCNSRMALNFQDTKTSAQFSCSARLNEGPTIGGYAEYRSYSSAAPLRDTLGGWSG